MNWLRNWIDRRIVAAVVRDLNRNGLIRTELEMRLQPFAPVVLVPSSNRFPEPKR